MAAQATQEGMVFALDMEQLEESAPSTAAFAKMWL